MPTATTHRLGLLRPARRPQPHNRPDHAHIAPDVDAERDHVFENLKATGNLADQYAVDGYHKKLQGRNGGGDLWHTDGRLFVGVIKSDLN